MSAIEILHVDAGLLLYFLVHAIDDDFCVVEFGGVTCDRDHDLGLWRFAGLFQLSSKFKEIARTCISVTSG